MSNKENFDYDLFVIGAGSGGVRLSRVAAGLGARVAVAEDRYLGGTCVNVGCVPKKLFVYASHVAEDLEDGAGFGWQHSGSLEFDWETLRENKNKEISRLNGVYQSLLDNSGVEIIHGRARLSGANQVRVGDRTYSARYIVIATGSWPYIPDFKGSEHAVSSNELFYLENFPKKAVVLGGGYIAVEMAGILNGLGVDTTLVYRGELFLRGFDEDVRKFVKQEIEKKGISLRFQTNIEAIEKNSGHESPYQVRLTDGSSMASDMVLVATGRRPHTQDLGLEETGLAVNDKGEIQVNQNFETNIPGIFALGDVTGGPQLTPVALAEGMALANYLFNGQPVCMDYDNIPTAVFCQPSIGTVGLTTEQAREQYANINTYTSAFRPMKHTMSGRDEKMFMRLIVNADDDRVLGAHVVGADAGEMIQGIAIAMKAGATKAHFDATIGIHPTAAEEFVTMRTPD